MSASIPFEQFSTLSAARMSCYSAASSRLQYFLTVSFAFLLLLRYVWIRSPSHAVNFGGVNDGIWAHDKALRTFAHNDTKLNCTSYVLIHVGKAAGTTLKHWFMGLPDVKRRKKYIVKTSSGADFRYENGHGHVLGDDANACYIFAVRDPIARWVSGFLSNARMGCPDHFHLHNIIMRQQAFFHFPTPNALAESLSHAKKGRTAIRYAHKIPHVERNFEYYLPDLQRMIDSHRIPMVLSLETLSYDIDRLERLIGLKSNWESSAAKWHSNPLPSHLSDLSDIATCNLAQLLRGDYALMDTLHSAGLIPKAYLPPPCTLDPPPTIADSANDADADEDDNAIVSATRKCFIAFIKALSPTGVSLRSPSVKSRKKNPCHDIVKKLSEGKLYSDTTCD